MRFGRITRAFVEGFRGWDARSKSAFMLALALLIFVLLMSRHMPESQRGPALIGIVGLLVAMQAIFLYANRGMVASVTQAQRSILAGRYDEARELLEKTVAEKSDVTAETLLGNAYRMLGRVDESRQTLTKALQTFSNGHFLLYSLGRTLMASGQYADAAEMFARALDGGAPPFATVDLAEARFRAGQPFDLTEAAFDEPHVAMMASYLRWQAGHDERPDDALVADGVPYWEKTAQRFAHTPYGPDVARDLAVLHGGSHGI